MLRRFVILVFVVLYGFSTSQAVVYLHYCCGELERIAIQPDASSLCSDHTDAQPLSFRDNQHACCQSDQINISESADLHTFKVSEGAALFLGAGLPYAELPNWLMPLPQADLRPATDRYIAFVDPPLIYIHNCTFRI